MSKIPSAVEFLHSFEEDEEDDDTIFKAMIEFAKLHVQAALKAALESIPCLGSSSDIPTYEEVKEEVLNAYPLNQIK